MRSKNKLIYEFLVIVVMIIISVIITVNYDLFENLYLYTRLHEDWELDEFFSFLMILSLFASVFSIRRLIDERRENRRRLVAEKQLINTNKELTVRIEEIKQLQGIIPICANCKKIRDGEGFWHQVEMYISNHTDAVFSHGLCEECLVRLYPEIYDKIKPELKKS